MEHWRRTTNDKIIVIKTKLSLVVESSSGVVDVAVAIAHAEDSQNIATSAAQSMQRDHDYCHLTSLLSVRR